jgi:hypothetical protein
MRRLPLVLLFLVATAVAQQPPLPPDLEPVPDGPPGVATEDDPGLPEVTIRRLTDAVVKEYRINNRLYMVQILPKVGLPYFLLDSDGDGNLETRYNDLDDRLMIPGWVILSW